MADTACGFAPPSDVSDGVLVDTSVATLSDKMHATLDRLQSALAKIGGADAPSQRFGDPAAGRALALMSAGVESPETVHMDTPGVREHLLRLFGLFSGGGASSSTATAAGDSIGLPGAHARMTALGFRKLVRAAQLTCDKCTDVDVDLIYQQVVRTRGARMTAADFMVGLAMVAKRLYPDERSQSAAFHRLLTTTLLPWMLQVRSTLLSAWVVGQRTRTRCVLSPCALPRLTILSCCRAYRSFNTRWRRRRVNLHKQFFY